MVQAGRRDPLIEILELRTEFETHGRAARAVDAVSLEMGAGEVLGLVGESGCGKSVLALSILGLVSAPGRVVSGDVRFEGRSLRSLTDDAMRRIRGNRIAMIFQEPSSSLNPVYSCGEQIAEVLRAHRGLTFPAARRAAVELLERVHLSEPQRVAKRFPHQLSGGMCQRVMIAMALACRPALLIADEPTTALDVTIQAQILELLGELRASEGMAILLITHDLGVVARIADRVAVMYAGCIVESASAEQIFARPSHPYTRGLLTSIPQLAGVDGRLRGIEGTLPDPSRIPEHCRFYDRCSAREERCLQEDPPLRALEPQHETRCLVDLPAWRTRVEKM